MADRVVEAQHATLGLRLIAHIQVLVAQACRHAYAGAVHMQLCTWILGTRISCFVVQGYMDSWNQPRFMEPARISPDSWYQDSWYQGLLGGKGVEKAGRRPGGWMEVSGPCW